MRKIPFRLGYSPIWFSGSYGRFSLELRDFSASPESITWKVALRDPKCRIGPQTESLICGSHGETSHLLPSVEGSWIAMSTPVVLHVGAVYRPEFIIRVPSDITME